MKALFSKGQMIYWCDPDDGLCSGPGTFVEYFGHDDARIVKDGGVIEVCASELGPVPIRRNTLENFDWLEHNISNDEKPAYVRRFMTAFVEHRYGFLRWLADFHDYTAHDVAHVVEHPWKYIEEFKAFADAHATPTTPQDLDPEKQARQDRLEEPFETKDLTDEEIPF